MKNIVFVAALSAGVAWPVAALAQIATGNDATKGQEAQSVAAAPKASSAARVEGATDEIIVTATKRASPLESVPVAVSVVSGETIENLNITNLSQLSRQTPSLAVTEGGEQTGGRSADSRRGSISASIRQSACSSTAFTPVGSVSFAAPSST